MPISYNEKKISYNETGVNSWSLNQPDQPFFL